MMRTMTPSGQAVLHRFETVTREAMIHLSRWKTEREEWTEQREELQRGLRRASSHQGRLMVIPVQAALKRAIAHIDRILAQGVPADVAGDDSTQVKP